MNIKRMNDICSQRQGKKKNSSILLKNKTKSCFLDDIDYLALCSKQTNGNTMMKPSKTHFSISPLRTHTKFHYKDNQSVHLNTSHNLKHRYINNETTFNPNKSMKLINFSQLLVSQMKKAKGMNEISFSQKQKMNLKSKQSLSNLNASSHYARSSFDIKSDIICPINIVSNRKHAYKNQKTNSTKKSFISKNKLSQPILNTNRLNNNINPSKIDWIKKSYLHNHIKRNSVNNEIKSRNCKGPIQFEWSKQATFTSMEKSIQKRKVEFSYDNRVSNYTPNISCNQTDDSSIPKKKDFQGNIDSVKSNGPEEMHVVFVILNQHKRKVYGEISDTLKLENDGIKENYLEYE